MNVLVIQHMWAGGPAALGETIAARGLGLDVRDVERGAALPRDGDAHAGLVVLGGIMNAHEDHRYPHLGATAALIARFHDRAKPVLGVCLGAQLLARACGARAYRHRTPELGFAALDITAAGARDPLLAGLATPQWLMQWHDDTFDLPAGAALLMRGAACPNQAFRLGAASYGFQPHFEVTRDLVRLWLADSRASGYHLAHADFYARIEAELACHTAAAIAFCRAVGGRWADLVAERAAA